jgi:hypothetical protein
VLIDLDRSTVNDTFGHQTGDQRCAHVSNLLKRVRVRHRGLGRRRIPSFPVWIAISRCSPACGLQSRRSTRTVSVPWRCRWVAGFDNDYDFARRQTADRRLYQAKAGGRTASSELARKTKPKHWKRRHASTKAPQHTGNQMLSQEMVERHSTWWSSPLVAVPMSRSLLPAHLSPPERLSVNMGRHDTREEWIARSFKIVASFVDAGERLQISITTRAT